MFVALKGVKIKNLIFGQILEHFFTERLNPFKSGIQKKLTFGDWELSSMN